MRLSGQALLATLSATLVVASSAAATGSPQELVNALVKAKVSSAHLSHGYSAPVVSAYKVSAAAGATVNGKKIRFGLTEIATLSDNVIVQAITTSPKSTEHGDVTGAVLLAQFALKRLGAAR